MNTVAEIDFAPARPEIVADKSASLPATLAPEAATIFQIIERAARDPGVDIDKMERLILMQERVQTKAAEFDFDNAMADAQREMQAVRADANNPQTKSKYASYNALDMAIRPIYTKYGFSLSFDTGDGAPEASIRIICKVAHRGGHRERPHLDMPADGKGAKGGDVMTRTHATGAAITYGKRYLLGMIFNIAVSYDDDGNAAGGHRPGLAGQANGGADFRPDGPRRQSSWGEGGKQGAIDQARADGLMDKAPAAKPLPGAPTTRGKPKITVDERAAKIKDATDKRIAILDGGARAGDWTRPGLNQFWVDNAVWIDWMSDPNNKVLAEYERFTKAFANAELTIKEIA